MKFLGMGVPELVIILVVILLIFGPKNLPKLGKAFGKTVSNLREGMNEGKKNKDAAAEEDTAAGEDEDGNEDSVPALEAGIEEVTEVVEDEPEQPAPAGEATVSEEAPKKVVKKVVKKKVSAE